MEHDSALPLGTVLLNYRLDAVLGSGGFGITYRAVDMRLESTVAIKEYFPAALAMRTREHTVVSRPELGEAGYFWGRDKFVNEAMSLARLQHPNIVGVDFLFEANGTAYMTLDYVDGPNMTSWLRGMERYPEQRELERLLFPLLGALEIVHGKGLLHRDIAPKNIMLAKPMMPVLIDFGAARQIVAQHSRTFAAVLTPGYAPFEQYASDNKGQGPWTDIYGLSATIYHAISGSPPSEAPDRILQDRCPTAVDAGSGRYSRSFLEAIDWGLRPLPKERPQSIAEWRTAFDLPSEAMPAAAPVVAPVDGAPAAAKGQRTWFWRQ